MSPLSLAKKYMNIVFDSGNLVQLHEILDENLLFEGPLFRGKNADEYINALLDSPPQNFQYKIIESFQSDHSACLIYEFKKLNKTAIMAQTFEISQDKISKIVLIFNTNDLL